jgi:hypothetical protein
VGTARAFGQVRHQDALVGAGGYRVSDRREHVIPAIFNFEAKRRCLSVEKDYDRLADSVGEFEAVAGFPPSTFEIEKLSEGQEGGGLFSGHQRCTCCGITVLRRSSVK